jgi:pimeloyl-ACP methyl ester carboxylesterase
MKSLNMESSGKKMLKGGERMPNAGQEYWFKYFPEHHMWSQVLLTFLEMAPWGGAKLYEVDKIGKRLRNSLGDNDAWFKEWTGMARDLEMFADDAATRGRHFTAGEAYISASMYYFCGERHIPPSDVRKKKAFERVLSCFRKGIELCHPEIERVVFPYENTTLPGYFYPTNQKEKGRSPAAVCFGGLDSTKEMLLCAGLELSRRGIACLIIDPPGQGEALRLQGIPIRHDYEVPTGAAIDYLETRKDVDPNRIGIAAWSMGGYYAPRSVAFEKRFKACVTLGAHYDYYAVWVHRRKVLESGGTKASSPMFQLPWVMGLDTMDQAMEKLKAYTLEGVAEKIECPILIIHGEKDGIVPVEMAYRLYESVSSKRKELRIFTEEEGGEQHCMLDNRKFGVTYIADWLSENLPSI